MLDARVSRYLDLALEVPVLRLTRQIDAIAVDVEFPTVIDAANAAFLVAAEEHRGGAMGTALVDEADAAIGVTECDEVLAEELHAHRCAVGLGDLAREQRRDPIAPHQRAHRRARPGPRQALILFPRQHRSHPLTFCPRKMRLGFGRVNEVFISLSIVMAGLVLAIHVLSL